jgi:CrcB protein
LMFIYVAIGGFFGAISRFGVSKWIKGRYPSIFPISTFFVNLAGSFLLGLIIGTNLGSSARLLLGTGFMGAFTTFSTLKLDSIQLLPKNKIVFILYLVLSYTLGIFLALAGIALGKKIITY